MGYSIEASRVRADLFTDSGKWKYTVALDYSGCDYDDWDLWEQARKALRDSTHNGTSGVSFIEIPHGWYMVVLEPYAKNGYPITVTAA